MNLQKLSEKYNTHLKCIKHLEDVRWGKHPVCPHCESQSVTARSNIKKSNRGRKRKNPIKLYNTPKYHCNNCNKDFTVLMGSIFEGSKLPLQKWFMLISLMLNARKGISSMQVSRDLGITYKTAWYSAMRVRCAMLDQADMLEGIVEMDEAYVGGKPRKRNSPDSEANIGYTDFTENEWSKSKKSKRGRGTKKIAVVGIVEREGKKRVVTQIKDSLKGKDLLAMLKKYVKMDSAIVMTDEYPSYKSFDKVIQHLVIKHKEKKYAEGIVHTNTIEGFWSIIKNGIRGQYHVLSKKYLPFYLAEFAYKYNRRLDKSTNFDETIDNALADKKCTVKYKPTKYPKFLAYRKKKKKAKA
jgi:transposase-like protein